MNVMTHPADLKSNCDKGMGYIGQASFGTAAIGVAGLYPLMSPIKRTVKAHPKYSAILASEGMDVRSVCSKWIRQT